MRKTLIIILISIAFSSCHRPRTLLEEVQQGGELVVLTRNAATTYYEGPNGPTGLEYDMAKMFADYLGVRLKLIVAHNFSDILPTVARGGAHLAAAGLTITDERKNLVRFGPSYQSITPQLIYRAGTPPPEDLDHIDGILEVVAGSSHEERLKALKKEHPSLTWRANRELESSELLHLVWEQVIDYTIADSNEVAINRRFYPELRVAFDIAEPQQLAWAFAHGTDHSLFNKAREFFAEIRNNGVLAQLIERHYGHVGDFDYVGTRRYLRHIESRLPEFIDIFQEMGEKYSVDWRLLAAIGYQESHWRAKARSPTGVRGIMMLTLNTMRHLGLDNRLDPRQSIEGGARYFLMMKKKIPERIQEPDRTWLALAAYNVGFGHLEDARKLTEMNGGDPDKWVDVKKNLPLLSQKKWYKRTKHGYARGREPVRYVENIRSYYDILVWYTERDRIREARTPAEKLSEFPTL